MNLRNQILLPLLLLCSSAIAQSVGSRLPDEVSIAPDAGRGGWVVVNLRLESGEELPFVVDSGTSGTIIDKSWAPKLGKPTGESEYTHWGVKSRAYSYAAPKFYLGGARLLMTGSNVTALDLNKDLPESGHPIMGILGMDVLRHYCLQIDFSADKLRFLDSQHADKSKWGKAFPIVWLNSHDARPAVAQNLLGLRGPHSLIDTGFNSGGWLMPGYYLRWTNRAVVPRPGEARSPNARFAGEGYPLVSIARQAVESDGIGLRFLARHLVTLDFPGRKLYLARTSVLPLPDANLKTTPMPVLDALVAAVLLADTNAAQKELVAIERGNASALEKTVARTLAATLRRESKLPPADAPPAMTELSLGDAKAESAQVGWLEPAENRIPLNGEIVSPLLDSGKIYATGLFAHSPSRYVFNLGGKWNRLRGEAGLHTAFQGKAFGVVFVIKGDGKELFRSATVRGAEHVNYDVNMAGVNTLELVVEQAQDRNGGNWALWLAPVLSR